MKISFTLLLSFFIITISKGQEFKGKVINYAQEPIQGAYVSHLKSKNHRHTDINGVFVFENISKGDTLAINHVGYDPKFFIVATFEEKVIIALKEKTISLNEVIVKPKIDALNLFTKIDIQTNPVNSSQEILQIIPGLIIGQHAGGGKAEQIFLRGFDIDHGTDININVDDIPVNMVSHAHGQGYADLHFLIPETIHKVDFGKGPYTASKGDFSTAGYVEFKTKDYLDGSSIKLELGQFNYLRALGMFDILSKENQSAYIATEYLLNDGPFESPQNFSRINLMGKYTALLKNNDNLSLTISTFTSTWDASGQIPQRAVDDGSITRFGSIDDTEGGKTSRTNLILNYNKTINENTFVKNTVYYSKYDFELYSNFTFYLEDPINGDQIRQKEDRDIFGLKSEFNKQLLLNKTEALFQIGVGYRNDQIDNSELSHTKDRQNTLNQISYGDINENNIFAYLNVEIVLGKFMINPALRLDYFDFKYQDLLSETYSNQSESKAILSPKLNFLYNTSNNFQLYLKLGKSFHSNDTRVVLAQEGKEILPAAYGLDVGLIWKPSPKIILNTAFWYLYMDQEFVYVGDAGVVEPSGKSRRLGADFGLRYQIKDWILFNADLNYAHARAIDEPEGENYIPLAPDLTMSAGFNFMQQKGFYGGIDFIFVKDRPANEDYSIVAEGYFISDLNAGYEWKNFDIGFNIDNLFNSEWNETQFATVTRLPGEPLEGVEDLHFIPGTPFFFRGYFRFNF